MEPVLGPPAGRIFDLWMAMYSQEEIAEQVGASVQPVKDVIADISANLPENLKPAATHLTDFELPRYNVWKQQTKTNGSAHFGNTQGDSNWDIFGPVRGSPTTPRP